MHGDHDESGGKKETPVSTWIELIVSKRPMGNAICVELLRTQFY